MTQKLEKISLQNAKYNARIGFKRRDISQIFLKILFFGCHFTYFATASKAFLFLNLT